MPLSLEIKRCDLLMRPINFDLAAATAKARVRTMTPMPREYETKSEMTLRKLFALIAAAVMAKNGPMVQESETNANVIP